MGIDGRRGVVAVGALLACALALPLGSSAATTAPAPKAPSVYTGGFTTVGTASVTFKGTVNPHGLATVYAFQFGTTTGYGAQTTLASAGNGTTSIAVSQTITGLPPGATYHYRLIATNPVGTTDGRDATFVKKIPLTFTLAGTPDPVAFGGRFTIAGVLAGTDSADRDVVLQANPYPYLGFKTTTAPTPTSASGAFSFPVAGLTENTKFRVAVAGVSPIYSRPVVERVSTRVTLHVRSTGRPGRVLMYGTVAPAVPGGRVALQLIRRGARPRWVASAPLKAAGAGASRFSRIVRIRGSGLYRAYAPVTGGKLTPGHSRPLLIG